MSPRMAWSQRSTTMSRQTSYLSDCAESLSGANRSILIDYDRLVSESANVLAKLSEFLELDVPLATTYRKQRFTGKIGMGDFSKNISLGRIVNTKDHDVCIPAPAYEKANACYAACIATLKKHCADA